MPVILESQNFEDGILAGNNNMFTVSNFCNIAFPPNYSCVFYTNYTFLASKNSGFMKKNLNIYFIFVYITA